MKKPSVIGEVLLRECREGVKAKAEMRVCPETQCECFQAYSKPQFTTVRLSLYVTERFEL